jgi:hypothetical protein
MSSPAEDPESSSEQPARFALGMLFVHGIGNQACGDTLLAGAGAIHRWLRGWCSGLDAGSVTVELLDTRLQGGDSPASARLAFRSGERLGKESWLLAESWWGQTFKAPTFLDVARWTVFIMPLAIRMHLGPRLRNAMLLIQRAANADRGPQTVPDTTQGFAEIARCMLLAPGLVIGGMAVQCLLVVLLVLAAFPVKSLRALVGRAQRVLAGVVGDSFIFVTSPVQEAAVVSKFQRDLAWLSERCEKVVVIAHSQGAAVAYRGLERLAWEPHWAQEAAAKNSMAGTLVGVSGVIALYGLVFWGWLRWENGDLKTFFAPLPYRRCGLGFVAFAVPAALLTAASIWCALAASSGVLRSIWWFLTLVAGAIFPVVWIARHAPGAGEEWAATAKRPTDMPGGQIAP